MGAGDFDGDRTCPKDANPRSSDELLEREARGDTRQHPRSYIGAKCLVRRARKWCYRPEEFSIARRASGHPKPYKRNRRISPHPECGPSRTSHQHAEGTQMTQAMTRILKRESIRRRLET